MLMMSQLVDQKGLHNFSIGKYSQWATYITCEEYVDFIRIIGELGELVVSQDKLDKEGKYKIPDRCERKHRGYDAFESMVNIRINQSHEMRFTSGWDSSFSEDGVAFNEEFNCILSQSKYSRWSIQLSTRLVMLMLWMTHEMFVRLSVHKLSKPVCNSNVNGDRVLQLLVELYNVYSDVRSKDIYTGVERDPENYYDIKFRWVKEIVI